MTKGKMTMTKYEDTPIGEITVQAARDMDLIKGDVERKDWTSVIAGVKYQVDTFTELLSSLERLELGGHLPGTANRSFLGR